jgi:hypothetical protein
MCHAVLDGRVTCQVRPILRTVTDRIVKMHLQLARPKRDYGEARGAVAGLDDDIAAISVN